MIEAIILLIAGVLLTFLIEPLLNILKEWWKTRKMYSQYPGLRKLPGKLTDYKLSFIGRGEKRKLLSAIRRIPWEK